MSENKQIIAAILSARTQMMEVTKSRKTEFGSSYKYATLEDYLDATIQPLLDNGLALICGVEEMTFAERITANKTVHQVAYAKIKGTLHHISGESLEVIGYGEGQDVGDKSIYKAITGARKYLIAALFNIYTTDDPETGPQPPVRSSAQRSSGKAPPAAPTSKGDETAQAPPTKPKKGPTDAELLAKARAKFKSCKNAQAILDAITAISAHKDMFTDTAIYVESIKTALDQGQALYEGKKATMEECEGIHMRVALETGGSQLMTGQDLMDQAKEAFA